MVLLDLLGRRWALRVLWELRGTQLTFRELQHACGQISPTVLNARLRELRAGKLVDLSSATLRVAARSGRARGRDLDDAGGYRLSAHGNELVDKFLPVVRWADRWARS
jgi:DNA-binding HxlR family transcriptional regulator